MSTGTEIVAVHADTAYPLAQRPGARVAANSAPGEYLSMRLGDEEYAIEILRVQEIRSFEVPTRIANSAPCVKGVLNLRGHIVPVMDLRQLLGMASVEPGASTVTIVLNLGGQTVGVVADAVNDVVELREQDIKPAPGFSGAVNSSHITGIGTIRNADDLPRMLILTDVQQLLASAGALPDLAEAA
jgi:purine-binding chemotaxis protein CheW